MENSIIDELKKAGNREILAGIKIHSTIPIYPCIYNIKIANTEGKELMSLNIKNNMDKKGNAADENIILSLSLNHIPAPLAKYFPFSAEKSEFILIDNPDRLSADEFKNPLMLDGGKSSYFYILIFKNNPENIQNIEYIKNLSIGYLDKNIPEERTAKLPDGTYMNELWSNPKRFSFSPDENNIFSLSSDNLKFEIAYAKNQDYIFICNSRKALAEFRKKHNEYYLSDVDNEFFFLNNSYIRNNNELEILNILGKYTEGEI